MSKVACACVGSLAGRTRAVCWPVRVGSRGQFIRCTIRARGKTQCNVNLRSSVMTRTKELLTRVRSLVWHGTDSVSLQYSRMCYEHCELPNTSDSPELWSCPRAGNQLASASQPCHCCVTPADRHSWHRRPFLCLRVKGFDRVERIVVRVWIGAQAIPAENANLKAETMRAVYTLCHGRHRSRSSRWAVTWPTYRLRGARRCSCGSLEHQSHP